MTEDRNFSLFYYNLHNYQNFIPLVVFGKEKAEIRMKQQKTFFDVIDGPLHRQCIQHTSIVRFCRVCLVSHATKTQQTRQERDENATRMLLSAKV